MGWRLPGQRAAHLRIAGDAGNVTSLIAGAGISLNPASGTGDVTITAVGGFPGFGGAPPAIAAASSAGAAGTASRSDHTHQGVTSVAAGDASITIAGGASNTPTVATTFGGAPLNVATASAAGAALSSAHSDHTHGLDVVTYTPSVVGMQAAGVIQQTFPNPTAVPAVLTMVVNQVPFGAATGLLQQSANFTFTNAAVAVLSVASTTTSAQLQLNNVTNNQNNRVRFSQSGTDYFQIAGARNAAVRNSINIIVFANVAAADRLSVTNDAGTITPLNVFTGNGDCGIGLQTTIAQAGVNGFAYLPIVADVPSGVPVADAALGSRQAVVLYKLTTPERLYMFDTTAGAWHFAEFGDFTPTYNSVTAQAATALTLTGNATSTWSTSAGGIVIRANTGGALGATSSQITFSAGVDITVSGGNNFVGAATATLGVVNDSWDNVAAKNYNIDSGGVNVGVLQSGGLSLTAAATQSLSKSGGLLFVQTTSANDLVFRTNSAESFRIDNATNLHKFAAASIVANGAVATALTALGPAGSHTTVQEWLTFLNSAGTQRWVPCF